MKPNAGELYYLRLLLLHVTGQGATSWQSLKRRPPDGGDPTFQEHARQKGLLHDDTEVLAALSEGCRIVHNLSRLCEMFAQFLVWGDIQEKSAF